MFDYAYTQPKREGERSRLYTTLVSLTVHVLVVGAAVALPILYASEKLPDPPTMMAFVVDAPAPPPPPPPPPPPAMAPKPAAVKPSPRAVEVPAKPIAVTPNAAPIEAPAAVTPETGKESSATGSAPAIEPGFEGGVAGGAVGGVLGGVSTDAPPPPPPPPPAPKPQGPVRVGGQIKAPQLAHRVNPVYPPAAQMAQVEGTVVVEATVGKDGRVQSARVVKSNALLDQAAMAAVKQWRYEPLVLNGEPTPFILTVTVSFSIPR